MSELTAVVMAVAAAAGAWSPHRMSLVPAALLVSAGLVLKRPLLLVVGVALATSAMAARSWDGLHAPVTGRWSGVVTLVTDPEPVAGGVRAEARMEGKRVEATWRGRVAGAVRDRLAGERVSVTGSVQPVAHRLRSRLASRHIAARMAVSQVGRWAPADLPGRVANALRRTMADGARPLPGRSRALFAGFVLGDGRDQSAEVTHDFRASGLSHLLVVSGQNVAFVLAVFGPLLRRLSLRRRMVAAMAVLFMFGVLTRWEPSVLRATAMAAIALFATTRARPASTLRILALAVTALLLVDPLLIHSVGFLLSTGACAGIALLGARFTDAIPGPRSLAAALGVTLAAQVGVAPVLVPVFGGLPVAAVPANLLAVPAAGPLMMWGMTGGMVAGLAGGVVATAVHVPTGLLVGWVAAVARWSATLPLGQLEAVHLSACGLAVAVAVVARRRAWPVAVTRGAVTAVVLAVTAPGLAQLRPPGANGVAVAPGARLWRDRGASVLVVDAPRVSAGRLMSALHSAGIRRIDMVALTRPGRAASHAIAPVLARFPASMLVAPPGHDLAGATIPAPASTVDLGGLVVRVEEVRPRLVIAVERRVDRPPGGGASSGSVGGRAPPAGTA